MARALPNSVFVIAVLQIVLGGLVFVFGLCLASIAASSKAITDAGVLGPVMEDLKQRQILYEHFIDQRVPHRRTLESTNLGLRLALACLMMISGYGLLKLQPWGRALTILYALLTLTWNAFWLVFLFLQLKPAVHEATLKVWGTDHPIGPHMAEMIADQDIRLQGVAPLISTLYAMGLFIWMQRPSITAVFAPPEPPETRSNPPAPP